MYTELIFIYLSIACNQCIIVAFILYYIKLPSLEIRPQIVVNYYHKPFGYTLRLECENYSMKDGPSESRY